MSTQSTLCTSSTPEVAGPPAAAVNSRPDVTGPDLKIAAMPERFASCSPDVCSDEKMYTCTAAVRWRRSAAQRSGGRASGGIPLALLTLTQMHGTARHGTARQSWRCNAMRCNARDGAPAHPKPARAHAHVGRDTVLCSRGEGLRYGHDARTSPRLALTVSTSATYAARIARSRLRNIVSCHSSRPVVLE